MSTLFKLAATLFLISNLLACNSPGHTSALREATLSADFDKSLPFAYNMPATLYPTDTSPGWAQDGQQISLTGTVYQPDGKTPAAEVILYYYQTDIHGNYATKPDEPSNMPKNELGQTHGYIRGWVKTGADGKYTIKTVMPGSYPSRNEPAHIHITVLEKNMKEPYYLDDFVFDDDPLLTSEKRKKMEYRGGSGVIRFVEKDGLWIGERNLILGLNIPNYPVSMAPPVESGKKVGEDVISFTPYHAYGPDKGTKTCPICKYGWYHGILYFVGNNPDWPAIRQWLLFLDSESEQRKTYLKAYLVYGANNDTAEESITRLEQLGSELKLKNVALTRVPSFSDKSSAVHLNKINQEVTNTFIIYRRAKIIGKFIDLSPNQANYARFQNLLDETQNEFFVLPRAKKSK